MIDSTIAFLIFMVDLMLFLAVLKLANEYERQEDSRSDLEMEQRLRALEEQYKRRQRVAQCA